MSLELDLTTVDFRSFSHDERIEKCRELAREATRLAANGNDEKRAQYSDLAKRWIELADEMENSD